MFELKIYTGSSRRASTILSDERGLEYQDICKQLEDRDLKRGTYYIERNGRLVSENSVGLLVGRATLLPRIFGGKGGFGSMLRAIGAQIEKTTNREACRDLSGRRLRDINEEKRLKAWIEKQDSREEEQVARKKRKLEKLCAVPKHEFKDRRYEEERSGLTGRVGDSVEEGLKMASAAALAEDIEKRAKLEAKRSVRKTMLDEDFDTDELESSSSSSDDSDDNEGCSPRKKLAIDNENSSLDGGGTSDESRIALQGSDRSTESESNNSESSRIFATKVDCMIGDKSPTSTVSA